jgi:hypothetical protein
VFRDAYSKGTTQTWYLSLDMHHILFHVKFEDGLSIPVSKNQVTFHKYLQLEIVKVLTKSSLPHFISHPAFSKLLSNGSKLGAWVNVRLSCLEHIQKSKVKKMISRRLLLIEWDNGQAKCRTWME